MGVEEPVGVEPGIEEPLVEVKPVMEEQVVEEKPVVEEPAVEVPVVEEPVVEEPVVEEPVVEVKPVVEEPAVEVPVVAELEIVGLAVVKPLVPKVEEPFHDSVSAETEMKEMVDTVVSETVEIDPLVTETPAIEEASTSEELPIIKKVLQASHHDHLMAIISGSDEEVDQQTIPKVLRCKRTHYWSNLMLHCHKLNKAQCKLLGRKYRRSHHGQKGYCTEKCKVRS